LVSSEVTLQEVGRIHFLRIRIANTFSRAYQNRLHGGRGVGRVGLSGQRLRHMKSGMNRRHESKLFIKLDIPLFNAIDTRARARIYDRTFIICLLFNSIGQSTIAPHTDGEKS
jgi:hypothetical protein